MDGSFKPDPDKFLWGIIFFASLVCAFFFGLGFLACYLFVK